MPGKLTWLKKVGEVALKIGELTPYGSYLKIFTPSKGDKIIDEVVNKATYLDEIGRVILQVESFSNALTSPISGTEKLKAASVPTAAILYEFLRARDIEIEDKALFLEGASNIADGFAKILNSGKAK